MISRRPLLELLPEEVPLYESVDGRKTVAELEQLYPGARERLLKWHEAAILELIPPLAAPRQPHLVVIEPHMDDAVISVGGRLLHRRGQCRITILSLVKWSNFTTYLLLKRNFLDIDEITRLRERESALAARLVGAEHRSLDWTDAPLRHCPPEQWSPAMVEEFSRAPHSFIDLFPNPEDVTRIAEQLTQLLSRLAPDEIWMPMGLGDHVDHRTTRSACLLMLAQARDRFPNVPVAMYEELPYAADVEHAKQIRAALTDCGTRLVDGQEDITDVFQEKLRLMSVYASQFKLSYMESKVRDIAEREGGGAGRLAETYHCVEGVRRLPPESRLSRRWTRLAALQTDMLALMAKRKEYRRLTVVLAEPPSSLGELKIDSESLSAALPNAEILVYASDKLAWPAQAGGSERVKVKAVHGRILGWAGVMLRELFRFRTPTLILWWGAYGNGLNKKVIKSLFAFRMVIFAATLSDFCGLLNEQIGAIIESVIR
ncbi:MAG: PIG-L family deacetylase [Acidobacteriia bacterium]|nr:PIG-L family deacetylase [Terriglobia bacterium]